MNTNELKVKELNAIKKLFNLRFCDEEDVDDLLSIIYSQSEEFRRVYDFEKIQEDFSSNAVQWFVLETKTPEECLLLAARFCLTEDSRTVQVFADKGLSLLTTKTRIINYFILQLLTVSHNLLYCDIILEVSAAESDILQLLEDYQFFDIGGYLIGSSLMILKYKKQIVAEDELTVLNNQDEGEIVSEAELKDVSEMTSLINDLFVALHKSPEFNENTK